MIPLYMECLVSIFTVRINSKSTQIFGNIRCPILRTPLTYMEEKQTELETEHK